MKKSSEEFWLERYNKVIKENQNLREQNLELSVSLKSANEYMMYQQAEITRLQNDLCTLNNSHSDRLELALQDAQDIIKSQQGEITRLSNEVFLLREQLEEKLARIEELEIEQATSRSKKEADRFNDLARTICGTQKYVNTSLNNPMSSTRKWPIRPKIIESSDESLDLSRSSSFALDDIRSEPGVSLYEEFFVVGYDYNTMEAGIIYQFPGTNITPQNPIYRVLPQFVFPSGIKTRSLALRESASDLHSFLYGQTNTSRNSNFYIFTLKAPEGTTGVLPGSNIPNKNKDKLYCVCYSTDDLVAYSNSEKPLRSSSQSHLISNKVFCLLSFYPCFALHFEVLLKISNLKKYNRMCILAGSPNTPYDTRAMKSLLTFTDDLGKYATDILENYHKYDRLEPAGSVKIDIPDGIDEPIDYTVPENLELVESEWLCPLLFSLLNLNDLYWLLMAAVQEKSIVFVSCSLAMVSSCV